MEVLSQVDHSFEEFVLQVEALETALDGGADSDHLRRFVHSSRGMETAPFLVARFAGTAARYCLYYRCHAWLLALGGEAHSIRDAILSGTPISSMQPRIVGLPVDFISVTVGAQLPIALGLALAGHPTVAALGDGALSTGVVFETLNAAAIHRPDLLFVLDDNGRAVTTAGPAVTSADPESLCASLGLGYFALSAGDVDYFGDATDWLRATTGIPRLLHVRSTDTEPHCLAMPPARVG